MSRIDIMVDLETLGLTHYNPIIQLAAVAFNLETGEIYDKFDVSCTISKEAVIDKNTYEWWVKTNFDLLKSILAQGLQTNISEQEMLVSFTAWIKSISYSRSINFKNIYLWGNGMLFDNMLLKLKCQQYNIEYPIHYQSDRDVRTLVDVYCRRHRIDRDTFVKSFKTNSYTEHVAIDDCMVQIKMLKQCHDSLTII